MKAFTKIELLFVLTIIFLCIMFIFQTLSQHTYKEKVDTIVKDTLKSIQFSQKYNNPSVCYYISNDAAVLNPIDINTLKELQ